MLQIYLYLSILKRIEIFTQNVILQKHANLPILFTSGSLFLQFLLLLGLFSATTIFFSLNFGMYSMV